MASPVPENEKIAGSVVVLVKGDISEIDWTSISRSVFVTGFRAHTTPEDLIIHFQRRKNGGGDIEKIVLSKKGTAVITFDRPEGERNNELFLYIELNSNIQQKLVRLCVDVNLLPCYIFNARFWFRFRPNRHIIACVMTLESNIYFF